MHINHWRFSRRGDDDEAGEGLIRELGIEPSERKYPSAFLLKPPGIFPGVPFAEARCGDQRPLSEMRPPEGAVEITGVDDRRLAAGRGQGRKAPEALKDMQPVLVADDDRRDIGRADLRKIDRLRRMPAYNRPDGFGQKVAQVRRKFIQRAHGPCFLQAVSTDSL